MSHKFLRWIQEASDRVQEQHRHTPILRQEGGQVFFESAEERRLRLLSERQPSRRQDRRPEPA